MSVMSRQGSGAQTRAVAAVDMDLYNAADRGDLTAVKTLLAQGANKNFCEPLDGLAPLHRAARIGNEAIIRVLTQAGADVNITSLFFNTPLHMAAWYGRLRAVKLLLSLGANAFAENKNGKTPLDLANDPHKMADKTTLDALRMVLDNIMNPNKPPEEVDVFLSFARGVDELGRDNNTEVTRFKDYFEELGLRCWMSSIKEQEGSESASSALAVSRQYIVFLNKQYNDRILVGDTDALFQELSAALQSKRPDQLHIVVMEPNYMATAKWAPVLQEAFGRNLEGKELLSYTADPTFKPCCMELQKILAVALPEVLKAGRTLSHGPSMKKKGLEYGSGMHLRLVAFLQPLNLSNTYESVWASLNIVSPDDFRGVEARSLEEAGVARVDAKKIASAVAAL